jgi:hypothetical protein
MILSHDDARREWRSFAADRRRKRCAAPFVPAAFPDTGVAPIVRRDDLPHDLSASMQSYSTPQKRHRPCSGITDAPPPPAPAPPDSLFALLTDSDFALRLRADIVSDNGGVGVENAGADLPDAGAWAEAVRAVADSLRQDPAARRQFMVGIDARTIRVYAAAATVLGADDVGKAGIWGAGSVVGGAGDAGERAVLPPPTMPRASCPPHRARHALSPASPAPPRQLAGRSAGRTRTTGGGGTGTLGETGRGWHTAEDEAAEHVQNTQDAQDVRRPATPTFEELMAESAMPAIGGRGGGRGERARRGGEGR